MIIIYHNNEKSGMPNAQNLVQKGFDNIYLLSNGLEDFLKAYPEECEGEGAELYRDQVKEQKEKLEKNTTSKYQKPVAFDDTASVVSGISKVTVKTKKK